VRYRKALTLFVWSILLFYPVSAIFMIGVYLSFVAHPLGMVLSVLSIRHLCLALTLQPEPDKKPIQSTHEPQGG